MTGIYRRGNGLPENYKKSIYDLRFEFSGAQTSSVGSTFFVWGIPIYTRKDLVSEIEKGVDIVEITESSKKNKKRPSEQIIGTSTENSFPSKSLFETLRPKLKKAWRPNKRALLNLGFVRLFHSLFLLDRRLFNKISCIMQTSNPKLNTSVSGKYSFVRTKEKKERRTKLSKYASVWYNNHSPTLCTMQKVFLIVDLSKE